MTTFTVAGPAGGAHRLQRGGLGRAVAPRRLQFEHGEAVGRPVRDGLERVAPFRAAKPELHRAASGQAPRQIGERMRGHQAASANVAKHRAGPTRTVTVAHQLHLSKFANMAHS